MLVILFASETSPPPAPSPIKREGGFPLLLAGEGGAGDEVKG